MFIGAWWLVVGIKIELTRCAGAQTVRSCLPITKGERICEDYSVCWLCPGIGRAPKGQDGRQIVTETHRTWACSMEKGTCIFKMNGILKCSLPIAWSQRTACDFSWPLAQTQGFSVCVSRPSPMASLSRLSDVVFPFCAVPPPPSAAPWAQLTQPLCSLDKPSQFPSLLSVALAPRSVLSPQLFRRLRFFTAFRCLLDWHLLPDLS